MHGCLIVVLVIAALYGVLLLVESVVAALPILLAIIVAVIFVVVICGMLEWIEKARADAEAAKNAEIQRQADEAVVRRNAEEKQKLERARRVALKQQAEATLSLFKDLIQSDCLVLDSNIWMNEAYDSFFYCLRRCATEAQIRLVLYGPQFDEMCNLKRSKPYAAPTNRRARLAINRVEQLQKDDLLYIEQVTINAPRDAYADPLIVTLLMAEAMTAKSIRFISDDKELRVRVREHLRKHPVEQWKIFEIKELIPGAISVVEAVQLNLIGNDA